MSISPFDSPLFAPLFTDTVVAAQFADHEQIRRMLLVEVALARVQARLCIIPPDAARRIEQAAAAFAPDPSSLAEATAKAGVPVMALVAGLRRAVGDDVAGYVHYGATSQDILDTALVLTLRDVLDYLANGLSDLVVALKDLALQHRATLLAARTRGQQAVPTSFGLKVAGWRTPLVRHLDRLAQIRPRLLNVQFGGAAGTLAALGSRGLEVMQGLADDLDLACPPMPWHSQRDGIIEIGGWFAMVSGSIGKIGQDLLLLAQTELGEVETGSGGGSSTMPQKANPVGAETLVALARFAAGLAGLMHQTAIHEHERGGAAWEMEWLTLPQMAAACGAAIGHCRRILSNLSVHRERMQETIAASKGLLLAEAAVFMLARHLPHDEAKRHVSEACAEVVSTGRHLVDLLAERTGLPLDWQALADPADYLGSAGQLIDRMPMPTSKGGS